MEDFITSEHMAGFHNTVQEGCYECHREQRLISAKKTVQNLGYEDVSDYNHSLMNPRDGGSPWDKNPLE